MDADLRDMGCQCPSGHPPCQFCTSMTEEEVEAYVSGGMNALRNLWAEETVEEEEVTSAAVEADDDEEEVFEIEIDDITYYATSEENGILYEVDADGEVGKKVGIIKDGEPFFS